MKYQLMVLSSLTPDLPFLSDRFSDNLEALIQEMADLEKQGYATMMWAQEERRPIRKAELNAMRS